MSTRLQYSVEAHEEGPDSFREKNIVKTGRRSKQRLARAARRVWLPLEPPHQVCNFDAEGIGDYFKRLDGDIALTSLNLSHMGSVQSGTIGEDILGPSAYKPQLSDGGSNLFLYVLHSQQFGGSLDKPIQVIPCEEEA